MELQKVKSEKDHPRQVEIAVVKYRVVEVNVNDCKFTAIFSIHMRWRDPSLTADDLANSKAWLSEWQPSWTPHIDFLNETDIVERLRCNFDTDDQGYVRYFARYRGEFYEPYELRKFPFDRHFLNIRISSLYLTKDVVFIPYAGKECLTETNFLAAWRMPPKPLDIVIDPVPDKPGYHFPRATVRCKIERASEYYLWNVSLVLFLIGLLCAVSMVFEPDELGDRLSVTLTMVLTAVAFKFVVQQDLPNIPYQTLLDRYILVCFVFLAVVGLQNTISRILFNYLDQTNGYAYHVASTFDWISLVAFVGAWVLGHLLSYIIIKARPPTLYVPYEEIQTEW